MKQLLTRQVPAARWFSVLACLFGLWCIFQWLRSMDAFDPPPRILPADRLLVEDMLHQGWLSGRPRLELDNESGAFAAPSPWGARAATLHIGRLEGRVWPDPATRALFREFALIHELVHIELSASRPQATDARLQAVSRLVYLDEGAFWSQVVDEAHADWQASVILLRRHGKQVTPFLTSLHQWRQQQSLFAPIDPHRQVDMVGPWLEQLHAKGVSDWLTAPVPLLRARLFDQTIAASALWLSSHPDDQLDLFRGTSLRFVLNMPASASEQQQRERAHYAHARLHLGYAPPPPRDPRPSRAGRWLWALSGGEPPQWWEEVASQADIQWQQQGRLQAESALRAWLETRSAPDR